MSVATCSICGEEKPFNDFKYISKKGGRCRSCHSNDVVRHRTGNDRVGDYLEDGRIFANVTKVCELLLLSVQNKANERLPSDRDLCEAMSIGRHQLRECLSVLTYLGFIKTVKAKGRYIKSPIDIKLIRSSQQNRSALVLL